MYQVGYCNGTRYFLTDFELLLRDVERGIVRVYKDGKLLSKKEVEEQKDEVLHNNRRKVKDK